MKSINKKTKLAMLIIAIIIVVGVIVTLTVGLNFDIRYQETKQIQLDLGKDFQIDDIKQITNEMLPDQKVMIQKVEVYEEVVSILTTDMTEEQKTNIVNKINEKYGTELSADSVKIVTIPHTRGRDIIRPYVMPFVIATMVILVYMAIRYYKLGITKTILKLMALLVITQAILLSIIAITRIPIGRATIPIVLLVYVLSLVGATNHLEKKLREKIEKESK